MGSDSNHICLHDLNRAMTIALAEPAALLVCEQPMAAKEPAIAMATENIRLQQIPVDSIEKRCYLIPDAASDWIHNQ